MLAQPFSVNCLPEYMLFEVTIYQNMYVFPASFVVVGYCLPKYVCFRRACFFCRLLSTFYQDMFFINLLMLRATP